MCSPALSPVYRCNVSGGIQLPYLYLQSTSSLLNLFVYPLQDLFQHQKKLFANANFCVQQQIFYLHNDIFLRAWKKYAQICVEATLARAGSAAQLVSVGFAAALPSLSKFR